MAKIVWQESEIETVNYVDDSEGESCLENGPHEISIYFPVKVYFSGHKIETQNKGDSITKNESRKYS